MNRRTMLALATILLSTAAVAQSTEDEKEKKARDELQGTWLPRSAELDGEKLSDQDIKSIKLVVTDDKYKVTVGDSVDEGTFTLDTSSDPRGMEIKGTSGPNKGKTIPAIYELKEDTLKVCYNLEGKDRPTEFKTNAGSKFYLVTYKREKR